MDATITDIVQGERVPVKPVYVKPNLFDPAAGADAVEFLQN